MELPLLNSDEPNNNSGLGRFRRGLWYVQPSAVAVFLAGLAPVAIPFLHFGVLSHLWDQYNYNVDTKTCTCPCWDTIFKGPYERGPSGYKHVYFNVTSNTLKIWSVTVLAVLLLYESVKTIMRLFTIGQVRVSMLLLLVLSIYPHYYSWWSYFNYWNDNFYSQWNHQLFFSITELASTIMVIHLLDRRIPVTSRKCLVITSIALMHIFCAGFDQFVENVVRGNGMMHQVLRDIFFMLPDLCLVLLPLLELRVLARQRRLPSLAHVITTSEFVTSLAFVAGGWIFSRLI